MKKNGGMRSVFVVLVALIAGLWAPSNAVARTWTPAGVDSNWFNAANWNPNDNWPQAGDDVRIGSGYVLLTNSTAALGGVTITNATLVFSNWDTTLSANTVTIQTNGVITHAVCNTNDNPANTNRINISCSNLTVLDGGSISAANCGFTSILSKWGAGPGGGYGVTVSYESANGGSHGGRGGYSMITDDGVVYGDFTEPAYPGSAGGSTSSQLGGAGGGVIRINATGAVMVNGLVSADGKSTANGSGGGSGGSVYIACLTFNGTGGVVTARGGYEPTVLTGQPGGGGGGGRIAVIYDAVAQNSTPPDVRILSTGGAGWAGDRQVSRDGLSIGPYVAGPWVTGSGEPGTLYFTDNRFLTQCSGTIKCSGQWMTPGLTSLNFDTMAMNNVYLRFTNDAFRLTVTNALTLEGDSATPQYYTRLDLTNGQISCGSLLLNRSMMVLYGGGTSGPSLQCGGDMVVTNSLYWSTDPKLLVPSLAIYAAQTNNAGSYGGYVQVGGEMRLSSNAYIYPYSSPTNGGSIFFDVGSLTMESNAAFDAGGKGYQPRYHASGSGPGGGLATSGTMYGGGYGGSGSPSGGGGQSYGNSNAPAMPGSAGGADLTAAPYAYAGAGGGLIWMNARGTITLKGGARLNADGEYARYIGGGGAGGGIYLRCRTLALHTNALLTACGGGHNDSYPYGGAGGGGRIAVWRMYDAFMPAATMTATGGWAVSYGAAATNGTIVWGQVQVPPPKGVIVTFL